MKCTRCDNEICGNPYTITFTVGDSEQTIGSLNYCRDCVDTEKDSDGKTKFCIKPSENKFPYTNTKFKVKHPYN